MATEVLIGQSYFLRFDPKLWKAMQPYPPLGALYAASYVRSRGFQTALFDAMLADSTGDWQRTLQYHRPRFAVIDEDGFNYLSKMCLLRMREAAFEMIEMARGVGAVVIVSGSDATDHSRAYFDKGADYVVVGEGEITLGDLLESLKEGRSEAKPGKIPGVRAKGFEGPQRELLRDLDSLPFPAWDLVDVDRYREIWMRNHGRFSVNMVSTRGCPYQCNWCAKPIYGQKYHCRSPANVVEELEWLRRLVDPDHISFCDDIFGLKPDWIRCFSQLVTARRLETPFKCLLRTDLVTSETAGALARAGCESVWMGVESGSQAILDAMQKGATVEGTRAATRLLRAAAIQVGFFLQFGYPGEDWSDIEKTVQMVRDCRPDDIGISVAYPLPGTGFYERVREELGTRQNWVDSDDLAMLYDGPFSTGFYRQLHRTIHTEYRGRRAFQDLKKGRLGRLPDLFRTAALPLQKRRLARMRRAEGRAPGITKSDQVRS